LDATGLYYFNARYYDPELGSFLSPDTLVPDPTNLHDYNRYMFVRGNPMMYNDPTGHCISQAQEGWGSQDNRIAGDTLILSRTSGTTMLITGMLDTQVRMSF
jgi:RHS repeat-associated protein